jgi:hypothetical protein
MRTAAGWQRCFEGLTRWGGDLYERKHEAGKQQQCAAACLFSGERSEQSSQHKWKIFRRSLYLCNPPSPKSARCALMFLCRASGEFVRNDTLRNDTYCPCFFIAGLSCVPCNCTDMAEQTPLHADGTLEAGCRSNSRAMLLLCAHLAENRRAALLTGSITGDTKTGFTLRNDGVMRLQSCHCYCLRDRCEDIVMDHCKNSRSVRAGFIRSMQSRLRISPGAHLHSTHAMMLAALPTAGWYARLAMRGRSKERSSHRQPDHRQQQDGEKSTQPLDWNILR